jgi:hypothetical protein
VVFPSVVVRLNGFALSREPVRRGFDTDTGFQVRAAALDMNKKVEGG